MNRSHANRRAERIGLDWASPVRRHTQMRWPGFVYIGTVVFLAIGAFNSQNALLFAAFGLGVAGVILSGIISGTALMGVSVVRESPGRYRVGRNGVLHYRIRNRNGLMPIFALLIEEADGSLAEHARPTPAAAAHCPAGQSVRTAAGIDGRRHGRVPLRLIRVRTSFPFGLMEKSVYFEQPGELLIRPGRIEIRHGLLRSGGRGRSGIKAHRNRVGTGGEVFGLRDYIPGDSPRMIAWKRSAASENLVVREMTSPAPPRAWIEIDEPPEGLPAHLLERGLGAAFSASGVLIGQGHAVGVRAPWAGVVIEPDGGEAHLEQIDRALGGLSPGEAGAYLPASNGSSRRGRGARIVVAFSEKDGQPDDAIVLSAATPERWLSAGESLPPPLDPAPDESKKTWIPRLHLVKAVETEGGVR